MTTCSGITARSLDVKQVSLEAAQQLVPDSQLLVDSLSGNW